VSASNSFLGLTWDHPRGYVALEQAAEKARAEGLNLRWERQPLEGFESHPIEELAERYDIIVLDHPHLGDAVHGECLQPLESVFNAAAFGRRLAGRRHALRLAERARAQNLD
jgi:multiple sugar transport system substrate-binding protein